MEASDDSTADNIVKPEMIEPTVDVNNDSGETVDPYLIIELGDIVIIESTKYGRVTGKIYYRDTELIRIMPSGLSDRLYDFPRIFNDDDDKFADDLGVTNSYIIEKGRFNSFTEQHDILPGNRFETLTKNGELVDKDYTVISQDVQEDSIEVQDGAGISEKIVFGFMGIPIDMPFQIIRQRGIADIVAPPIIATQQDGDITEELVPDLAGIKPKTSVKIVGFVFLPKVETIREAKAHEKVYPDSVQKTDALNDFLNMLEPAAQKDPNALRSIRILVESLYHLKQSIIETSLDGTILGAKSTTVHTMAQLLQNHHVPLSRAVLSTAIRLFMRPEDEEADPLISSIANTDTDNYYFEKFSDSLKSDSGAERMGAKPWRATSTAQPLFRAIRDTDFFRERLPTVGEEQEKVSGYVASEEFPIIGDLDFSLLRSLSVTIKKEGGERKIAIPADTATIKDYVLFPRSARTVLGSTRSGSLAVDSGRSKLSLETTRMLLKRLGGIHDVTTSDGILSIGVSGNTLGNILVKDYIDGITDDNGGQTGFRDFVDLFSDLGMSDVELNADIFKVVEKKILKGRECIHNKIGVLRQKHNEELTARGVSVEIPVNNLLTDPEILEQTIRSEPALVAAIEEFQFYNPYLAKSDIALTAHLLKSNTTYFQTALGNHPQYVSKERNIAIRDNFMKNLLSITRTKQLERETGIAPAINRCEHVANLKTIRGIRDNTQRYEMLTKFFIRYQGRREDNFVKCALCDKNLMCVHERLQLQAYLNPKEQSIINKELVLTFSGGQFSGHYTCKNCGQPIEEIGYDTHIEYDDNGHPMMGRSVLVDHDAVAEEKLDTILRGPTTIVETEAISKAKFETASEGIYYETANHIASLVDINIDLEGYKRIVANMTMYIGKLPSRIMYEKAKLKPEYDMFINVNIVCAAGVFLLLEIQIHIPDYMVRVPFQGCEASFEGFPLGAEADRRGFEYISCVISSIKTDNVPWNRSGLQGIAQDKQRQTHILKLMLTVINHSIVKNNSVIQESLITKKKYLREKYGTGAIGGDSRASEQIPPLFFPIQRETDEERAADAIIPEVASVNSRPSTREEAQLIRLWIRLAHSLAKKTAPNMERNPLSGTTCCLTHINSPDTFWKSVPDLPKLSGRILIPNTRVPFAHVHFAPRPMIELSADVPENIVYRLFLKVCFRGPRKGLVHELGLAHQCSWCGFQFPSHPSTLMADTDGKMALTTQNVRFTKEDFIDLLDIVHINNRITPYSVHIQQSRDELLSEFIGVNPSPTSGWQSMISETIGELNKLNPTSGREYVVRALGPISDFVDSAEQVVKSRLDNVSVDILEGIGKLKWHTLFQVIQSYFIIPFNRINTSFTASSLFVPSELKLSDIHSEDVERIIMSDGSVIEQLIGEFNKDLTKLAKIKLQYFIRQMSAIAVFKNKITGANIPGKEDMFRYLQSAVLYGPLSDFINASFTPPDIESIELNANVINSSSRLIIKLVKYSLDKYSRENVSFSDEELRNRIATRNEKEKAAIINTFDKMSDEESAVFMTTKRLGIGRWAVGGTAAIYAYDPDQYDREREERATAGIVDFPAFGEATNMVQIQQDGPGDGYDHVQTMADDA